MASSSSSLRPTKVRSIWHKNMIEEFTHIRSHLNQQFSYVSLDTEFPGTVIKPSKVYHITKYNLVKANVESLNIIQLGLTLTDKDGNLPVIDGEFAIWEINFSDFDINNNNGAPESLDLLKTQGIDFQRLKNDGVHSSKLFMLLGYTGIILGDKVKGYICFHGIYDFAYLLKSIMKKELPNSYTKFLDTMKIYFKAEIFDVKHIMTSKNIKGGLSSMANSLGLPRVGVEHNAGSDSLLTWGIFKSLRDSYFTDEAAMAQYSNILHESPEMDE